MVSAGKVSLHHVLPESGWASYWISGDEDEIDKIIDLFKIQYDGLKSKKPSSNISPSEKESEALVTSELTFVEVKGNPFVADTDIYNGNNVIKTKRGRSFPIKV